MLQHEQKSETKPFSSVAPLTNLGTAQETASASERGYSAETQISLEAWAKQQANTGKQKYLRLAMSGFLATFVLAFPALVALGKSMPTESNVPFTVFALMLITGFFGSIGTVAAIVWEILTRSRNLPMPIADDLDGITALLDRSMFDYTNLTEIYSRLSKLLPRLQAHDAYRLERRHYELLNAYLRRVAASKKPAPFGGRTYLCAVLDAYSRIGDGRTLADVERIAAGKAAAVQRDPAVLEAAQNCLPYLRQAAAELQAKETLLRGAQPSIQEEALLRPATTTPGTNEQLLRAAYEENNDAPNR